MIDRQALIQALISISPKSGIGTVKSFLACVLYDEADEASFLKLKYLRRGDKREGREFRIKL